MTRPYKKAPIEHRINPYDTTIEYLIKHYSNGTYYIARRFPGIRPHFEQVNKAYISDVREVTLPADTGSVDTWKDPNRRWTLKQAWALNNGRYVIRRRYRGQWGRASAVSAWIAGQFKGL